MNLDARDAMRKLASSYSISRQISFQEGVYYSLPELWLRICFPRTVFVKTSVPSELVWICKSLEEIEELNADCTDIFKQNMVGRYIDRPNSQYKNGMYGIVDLICFAIFVAHYYLDYENKDDNDSQPDVLGEETKETPEGISETSPKSLPLISPSEILKLWKSRQVLRRHVPNKHFHLEKFAHCLLFMFYPFLDENVLKINNSYCQKLVEEGVLHTINKNKSFLHPNCKETNNAFIRLSQVWNEISDVDLTEDNEELPFSKGVGTSGCVNMSNLVVSGDSMREMVRSLNSQQRQIFDDVYNWCKSKCKYQNSLKKKKFNHLNVFISGESGVGKLYLINTLFHTLTRTFNLYSGTPEKVTVLKMASTGVVVVNINGTTISTALGTPATEGNDIPKLSDKMRCKLRLMYSELEAVIIDETSMVSNIRLYRIHYRLCEIFNVSLDIPFAGLTIVLLRICIICPLLRDKTFFHLFIIIYWLYVIHGNILVISS